MPEANRAVNTSTQLLYITDFFYKFSELLEIPRMSLDIVRKILLQDEFGIVYRNIILRITRVLIHDFIINDNLRNTISSY